MEDELQRKLHLNSRLLKEEFKGSWEKMAGILKQYEIIKNEDIRKVITLPDDREKVDLLLKILSKSKQCERFVEVLEQTGFSDVCKKIKETDSQREKEKTVTDKTFVIESKPSEANTATQTLEQTIERNLTIFKGRMDKKNEELMTQIQDSLIAWNKKFEEKDNKYTQLQVAYTNSRKKVDSLTNKLQEKNFENHDLKKENESLRNIIKELEQQLEVSKSSEEGCTLTESQQSRIEDSEDNCMDKTEVVKFERRESHFEREVQMTEAISRLRGARTNVLRKKVSSKVKKKDVLKK